MLYNAEYDKTDWDGKCMNLFEGGDCGLLVVNISNLFLCSVDRASRHNLCK